MDDKGRIFVLLCGRLGDKDWDEVAARGTTVLLEAREKVWSDGCQIRQYTSALMGDLDPYPWVFRS